jgi:DnaJ family protein C protein 17
MNEAQKKLLELDLYALLDIEDTSSVDQIRKAYRKKALELHPDKNLNNKELAERQFIELGKVFEILTDSAARACYDTVRRNKKEREKRNSQLDDKRRKFKEDLESRENLVKAQSAQKQTYTTSSNLTDEERLRKEVSLTLNGLLIALQCF